VSTIPVPIRATWATAAASANTVHCAKYPPTKANVAGRGPRRSARRLRSKVSTTGVTVGAIMAIIMTTHMRNVRAR